MTEQVEIFYTTHGRVNSLLLPATSIRDAMVRAIDHGIPESRIRAIINHNTNEGPCLTISIANAAATTSTRKRRASARAASAGSASTATPRRKASIARTARPS